MRLCKNPLDIRLYPCYPFDIGYCFRGYNSIRLYIFSIRPFTIFNARRNDCMTKCWIDALEFENHGGWSPETQFAHEMGQGYLMAIGLPRRTGGGCIDGHKRARHEPLSPLGTHQEKLADRGRARQIQIVGRWRAAAARAGARCHVTAGTGTLPATQS